MHLYKRIGRTAIWFCVIILTSVITAAITAAIVSVLIFPLQRTTTAQFTAHLDERIIFAEREIIGMQQRIEFLENTNAVIMGALQEDGKIQNYLFKNQPVTQ